jgi:tetratricopeptide (TPR) repeat protein
MRKVFAIIVMAAATLVCTRAKSVDGVTIERYKMERSGDSLRIDIRLNTAELNIKSRQVAVITPAIVKNNERVELRSCGIYSRMRDIYYTRNEHLAPTKESDMRYRKRRVPEFIDYSLNLPYTDWMDHSSLVLCHKGYGCCGAELWNEADTLVEQFPRDIYTPQMLYLRPKVEVVKTRALRGTAYIDFPVSRMEIYPTYHNNAYELNKIIGTIDSVKNDKDITIKHLAIKGFASPESPYTNNARLARGRTESLKQYVEQMYHFGEGFIETSFEPENWAGLEAYVAQSNLEHKAEILAAIRSEREPDNKEWFIKKNWPKDYRFLLENCYPMLRRSDYRIEYEIRNYTTPAEIEKVIFTAPQKLSLEEFYILAESYEPGSDLFNEVWEIAIRMYPNDGTANLNAANTAILKGDFERAESYLERASDCAEAIYARGVLEAMRENYNAARPLLEKAEKMGITKAREVIENMGNRWVVTSDDKNSKQ